MPRHSKVYGSMTLERGDQEIDVGIQGVFWPGDPGSYWQPPEGPMIEDVEAFIGNKPFELTDAEYETAIDVLMELVNDGYFEDDGPEYDKYDE